MVQHGSADLTPKGINLLFNQFKHEIIGAFSIRRNRTIVTERLLCRLRMEKRSFPFIQNGYLNDLR